MRLNERFLYDIGFTKADLATLRSINDSIGGGLSKRSVAEGLVATAGGGQTLALILDKEVNVIVTVAVAGDSVKLIQGKPGNRITIMNHGANVCNVFPFEGGDISAGINTAISLAAGANVTYQCWVTDQWEIT